MAKQKKISEQEEEKAEPTMLDLARATNAEIDKLFGPGLIRSGQDLVDTPKMVIPVSPAFDIGLGGGILEGSWVTMAGLEKQGKALPIDSIIYTPNGPKTMGDIKIGDFVCNDNGGVSKVIGVYPQGKKKVYKINFTYGDSVESCDEHLWEVQRISSKKPIIKTLKDFKQNLKQGNKCVWSIKLPKPVYFHKLNELPINPYLLGLLIGDGGLTCGIRYSSADEFLLEQIRKLLPDNHKLNKVSGDNYDYQISKGDNNINLIQKGLEELKLFGLNSKEKFIPSSYLYTDLFSRLEIIRGLLDTDGSVGNKGNPEFYTSSYQLALDFQFLIESIGGAANISEKITTCNNKKFKSWKLVIRYDGEFELFKLPRKLSKVKKRVKGIVKRNIQSVEFNREVECQCIELEGENKLYLTNHCVPTHNTTTALSFCANAQKIEYGNRPVMFLSVEHRLKSRDLLGIKGLKIEEPYFYFVESKKGKILSSIDFLNIGSTFLKNTPGGVLVVDSFSSLLSPKLLSDGLGASDFGKNNQYIAQFCESMAPIVKTNDNIVIGILQYYTNTSGYGKKFAEKTAKKLAYQADVQLQIKNSTPWTVGAKEDGELIGQYQDWIIKTSGIGKPGVVTSYIRYGIGIDKVQELFLLAVNLGLVEKGGAWYNFVYLDKEDMVGTEYEEKGEVKIQGEAKSNAALEEYPKWFEKLERKVKEFLGIK